MINADIGSADSGSKNFDENLIGGESRRNLPIFYAQAHRPIGVVERFVFNESLHKALNIAPRMPIRKFDEKTGN